MEIAKYLVFLQEAERLKSVTRTAWSSTGRRESTAEHSWRLALFALVLSGEYPDLDGETLLALALVHDLGEAYDGDVSAALHPDPAEKHARERAGMERLCDLLPQKAGARLLALWDEYDRAETPEARLIKALDKAETLIQHHQGKSPQPIDFRFNLDYGREYFQDDPKLAQWREVLDALTAQRMDDSGLGET